MRFAVIGSNFITQRFLEAARLCEDFTLTGYYSREMARARECAAEFGAPLAFDSLDALAACPEIDAVYIASPNSLHAPQALQMLRAKKHVLCEKPAASNSAELAEMLTTARQNGVLVLEAMRPLFAPGLAAIRTNLPRLGTVRRATFNYCQYSSRYDKFKTGVTENAFNPAFSNGAIMDIGVYCVAPLVALFGMPEHITTAGIVLPESIDGVGTILAQYKEMIAELSYSKITNSHSPSEIQGENGCMYIQALNCPQQVSIRWNNGESETLEIEQQPHDMLYELREFIRLAAAPQLAEPYHKCTVMALRLMDEARAQLGVVFPADKTNGEGRSAT